jgi:tubulin gamma
MQTQSVRRTSVLDVLRRLLQQQHQMASVPIHSGCYGALMAIIQGGGGPAAAATGTDPLEIHKALQRIKERRLVPFIPWGPATFQIAVARRSQFLPQTSRVTGLLLANHTNFRSVCFLPLISPSL